MKPYFILTLNHLTLPVTLSSESGGSETSGVTSLPNKWTLDQWPLTVYNLKIEWRNVPLVGDDVDEQVAILADHVDRFESVGRFRKSQKLEQQPRRQGVKLTTTHF